MTNIERARKIASEIVLESRQDRFSKATIWEKHLEEFIAAQLDEVERQSGLKAHGCVAEGAICLICARQYEDGFRAARDKAKGIVIEEANSPKYVSLTEIAERIAGMEP